MDVKLAELATALTVKAMRTEAAASTWIGNEEKVSKFLKTMYQTLDQIDGTSSPGSGRMPG